MPWSDWQPGFALTAPFSAATGTRWSDDLDEDHTPVDGASIIDLLSGSLGVLTAGAVAVDGGITSGDIFTVGVTRTPITPIVAPDGDTKTTLVLDQISASWYAAPYNPFPPPLNDLVEGVDYAVPPDAVAAYEYESPDPVSHSWPETMLIETGGRYSTEPMGSAVGIPTPFTDLRIDALTDPIPDGHVGVAVGTPIASVRVSADDGAPEPGPSGFDGSTGNIQSVSLPGDLGIFFTLAVVADMAPGGLWDGNASPDFSTGGIVGAYGWGVGFAFGTDEGTALDFTWTTSRWRYWIPGPVLKTVGENFLSGSGETNRVKSLIPGYGWLPVQRHG